MRIKHGSPARAVFIIAIVLTTIIAPVHVHSTAAIKYIEYRITGSYKSIGKGQVVGTGSFNILINITIHPPCLNTAYQRQGGKEPTPRAEAGEIVVDARYAEIELDIKGDRYISDKVFDLLVTPGTMKYLKQPIRFSASSLYQGIIAVYVPPEILKLISGHIIYNNTVSWLIKIKSSTKAYVARTDNMFEASITATTRRYYIRSIQQYFTNGWLRQGKIYIVTTINIEPNQLPFIYTKTIQATLIIQAKINAEKSNIIKIPKNPIEEIQQYKGLIMIATTILAAILIKTKIIPYLKKKICTS